MCNVRLATCSHSPTDVMVLWLALGLTPHETCGVLCNVQRTPIHALACEFLSLWSLYITSALPFALRMDAEGSVGRS